MIGTILGGRYQILERIGGGGMAIVYRGLDVLLHRPVSVKTLRPELVGDADFLRRFKREAQAAASLSHPNVVNIYDVGQDGDAHYIVMEFVDGKTLKQVIEERAPLPVDEAVGIARQICDALAHAHEHNIVHRDVKPHNILISKTGRVKVTDFGIARAVSTNTITHHSSSVLGSVHYFSPEQARGTVANAKSDVYSLGVVLYEMLTGRVPFSGDSLISIALKHLQEPIVEPRSFAPRIPQSVENIVLRALQKDPRQRYQSVRQMADDLERALLLPDVAKFVSSSDKVYTDPAQTIEIPIIRGGMMPPFQEDGVAGMDDLEMVPEHDEDETPRPWWKRLLIFFAWFFGLLALTGVAAFAAMYLITTFGRVPAKQVPSLIGMTYQEARQELVSLGFQPDKIHESFDPTSTSKVQIGQVESQSQGPGKVQIDQNVSLIVKSGSAQVTMPSLTGELQSSAQAQLVDMGVPSGNITVTQQPSATVPVNQVISTTPATGTPFSTNTTPVTLVVSSGAQYAAVPSVVGRSLTSATSTLKADGFALGQVTHIASFTVANNQVISQSPQPGQQASSGSSVDLTVSSGQPAGTAVSTQNVQVSLPPGTLLPATVKIVVTDATGTNTVVNASQSNPQATYPAKVTTTAAKGGEVDVYIDGQLNSTQIIPAGSTASSGSTSSSGAGTPSTGTATGTGSTSSTTGSSGTSSP